MDESITALRAPCPLDNHGAGLERGSTEWSVSWLGPPLCSRPPPVPLLGVHSHHHCSSAGECIVTTTVPLLGSAESPSLFLCWGVHSHHHCPSAAECIFTTTVPLLGSAVTTTVPLLGVHSHHHCPSAGSAVTITFPLLGSA